MTRIKIDPKDPKHPVVIEWIKPWRYVDYRRYFECSEEDQIGFLKGMNIDSAELVHDPTLEMEFASPEPGPLTAKRIEKPGLNKKLSQMNRSELDAEIEKRPGFVLPEKATNKNIVIAIKEYDNQ